jgi:hypothetical protein
MCAIRHFPRHIKALFGKMLKEKCDRLGVPCRFYHWGAPAPEGAEVEFLKSCYAGARR